VRTEARYPERCASASASAGGSAEGQAVRADVSNYATGGVVVLDYELRGG
jgi:hypothetical protein